MKNSIIIKCVHFNAALVILFIASLAPAATYTVINTNNSGAGSLRQAIIDSNANSGADIIDFDIPGTGPHTISLTSFLPAFTDQITIDGYSQPGAARATETTTATIMIELDGSSAGEDVGGLYFFTNSSNSRVSGLVINNFNRVGIYLLNSQGTWIEGNYIGCDPTGTIARPNDQAGIEIQQESSNGTFVGGTEVGQRNIISGNNGDGISIVLADNCVIKGNYIGCTPDGTMYVSNTDDGIDVYGDHTTIGGVTVGERNVISGNLQNGIKLDYAQNCHVVGNYIGTDKNGLSLLPNAGHGIHNNGDYNTIGGTNAGEGNVISGNHQQGINLVTSTHNTIIGNHLGTNSTGTAALPNRWSGICMAQSSNYNTIGGETSTERNLISGNDIYGVDIQSSTGIVLKGNFIGTDINGGSVLANGYNGVSISHGAYDNTIGGGSYGQGNIISGNTYVGLGIDDAHNNIVAGNYIGTVGTGIYSLANEAGIVLSGGAHDNRIGGTATGEGNTISGNTYYGIEINGSSENIVEGNYIGTDKNGTGPLANGGSGIYIDNTSNDNTFGSETDGAGNIIAYNGASGICVKSGTGNSILHNSIHSNTGLGIDLDCDGITPNDTDDPDSGPNRLQNFPDLDTASLVGSDLRINYIVSSITPNSTYPLIVEFFKADDGEGKIFLGSDFYSETGPATVLFSPATEVNHGDEIVSTATDSGDNSSEFSASVIVAPSPTPSGTPTPSLTPTLTPSMTPTPTPSTTPSLTPSTTPSPTPSTTPSVTPSNTPTPSTTPSPTPSTTPTATPTSTSTPRPTATITAIPSSTPTPTPTCGPSIAPARYVIASGDYDGDGTSDIAVFRPSAGLWAIRGLTRTYFGNVTDLPACGDYNGDGVTDVAIFRKSTGLWAVRNSTRIYFGATGDLQVPSDYDGDGYSDIAIFRESSGLWMIKDITRVYFGAGGDWPVPGDFNGDGTNEIGVFRSSSGLWAIRELTRNYFGREKDWPIAGDYSGDGTWDISVFRPGSGLWATRNLTRFYYGCCLVWPNPADYNGDLVDDIGTFRPATGLWALRGITRVYYGTVHDIPATR